MKVTLNFEKRTCVVEREPGDKRLSRSGYSGQVETVLLTHIKRELVRQGYDVITKRMWRDGHMVDGRQVYIRTRKWTDDNTCEEFCVYNPSWAVYDAGKRYNEDGMVRLDLHF